MINTFCDNILNVYTHCSSVKSVYTYGSLVWPNRPLPPCPPCEWYVSWTPTSLSQRVMWTYLQDGRSLWLPDYSGYFTDFSGVIPSMAFQRLNPLSDPNYIGANIYYLNTNAYSISDGKFFGQMRDIRWPHYSGAFYYCSNLTLASLSNCKYIGRGAFARCTQMSYVYAPVCEYVNNGAFDTCIKLSSVFLPECKYLGGRAFYHCSELRFISLPECSYIGSTHNSNYTGNGAFNGCIKLSNAYLPKCEYIGDYGFANCSLLSSVSLPVCSYIGNNTFLYCSSLTGELIMPECEYLGKGAFYSCINLSKVVLGKCSFIDEYAFKFCSKLSVLEIGNSEGVCKIESENLGYISSSFSIYVPYSYLNMYKISPSWSNYSSRIFPISVPPTPMVYNISWTTSTNTGTVNIDGVQHNLSEYQSLVGSQYVGYISTSQYIMRGSIFKFIDCSFIDFSTDMLSINSTAFVSCSMSTLSASRCMYIVGSMSLTGLTRINLPYCENIGANAFYGCSTLLEVSLPKCTRINNWAFFNCSGITSITIPNCEYIYSNVFYGNRCSVIDLPVCSYIGEDAFGGNRSLSMYLRSTSMVSISGYFNYNIYVPSSLYRDYISEYSSYSSRIFSIPE